MSALPKCDEKCAHQRHEVYGRGGGYVVSASPEEYDIEAQVLVNLYGSDQEAYERAAYLDGIAHARAHRDALLAGRDPRVEALRQALEKAADTFADIGEAMRILGRFTVADACKIAETSTRAALANTRANGGAK